jgi:hypothetical protein
VSSGHYKQVCERCGAVVAQCRCMSCDKAVVVNGLCAKCAAQPQDKGSAGQQSASPCNNARDEICAHYVQFEDCVFFPGDVSCGEKGCTVKPRRLSPVA